MGTGLYDIRERLEVLTPPEIAEGYALSLSMDRHYICHEFPGKETHSIVPLATYKAMLEACWTRAAQTARMIDNMRSGYCTIEAKGAPPQSKATH